MILTVASALALGLVFAGPSLARGNHDDVVTGPRPQQRDFGFRSIATRPLRVMEYAYRERPWQQIRIEQHVIIRIAPSPPDARDHRLADLPHTSADDPSDYKEVPHGDCVNIDDIAGVASTTDNRLLLFMRDNRVLAATLRKSCPAQAFYSGFYVERSKDGRLCAQRDTLHSRAGQSCSIDSLSRVVAAGH